MCRRLFTHSTILPIVFIVCLQMLHCFSVNAAGVPSSVLNASSSVLYIETDTETDTFSGSSFIVYEGNAETYLLTNEHVVQSKNATITIWLDSDRTTSATIVASSEEYDLALLSIPSKLSVKPIPFASNVNKGDEVYSIGFPSVANSLSDTMARSSDEATITNGIVSAIRSMKIIEEGKTIEIVQTNCDINPGNSGGPLLNSDGLVVGINTYGVNDANGIYGAISISSITEFLKQTDLLEQIEINDHEGSSSFSPKPLLNNLFHLPQFTFPIWYVFSIFTIIVFLLIITFHRIKINNTKAESDDNTSPSPRFGLNAFLYLLFILSTTFALNHFIVSSLISNSLKNNEWSKLQQYYSQLIIKNKDSEKLEKYIQAGTLLHQGYYSDAEKIFQELSGFLSSEEMAKECVYQQATDLQEKQDFIASMRLFNSLGEYKDSPDQSIHTRCLYAESLLESGDAYNSYLKIYEIYETNDDTRSLFETIREELYSQAITLYRNGSFQARTLFEILWPYQESETYLSLMITDSLCYGRAYEYTHESDEFHSGSLGIQNPLDNQSLDTLNNNNMIEIPYGIDNLLSRLDNEDVASYIVSKTTIAGDFLSGSWHSINDSDPLIVSVQVSNKGAEENDCILLASFNKPYTVKGRMTINNGKLFFKASADDSLTFEYRIKVLSRNVITLSHGYTQYTLYRN